MAYTRSWLLLLVLTAFLLASDGGRMRRKRPARRCARGRTSCNGVCVRLANDTSNCGACNRACAAGEACAARVCKRSRRGMPASPSPSPSPNPSPSPSLDDARITPSCSAVGTTTCASTGPACCPGLTCCSGECVNTTINAMNCGACDALCMRSDQSCTNGACAATLSLVANINLGPFNMCNATGAAVSPVPRCRFGGATQVPGYVVTVTPGHFAALGVKAYPAAVGSAQWCLRASLCGMAVAADTQLDLAWAPPPAFTAVSPEGPWATCTSNNCPNTPRCSNIIIPNTGSPAGETLQIQSSNGNCVSGITIILRVSPDCAYSTPFVGPL